MSETHDETTDDTVARRIVMRRETWDELVHLADALRETRGIEVTPTDVATIALEAGLSEVRKSQGAAAPAASQKKARSGSASRSAALSRSGSGARTRPAAGRIQLEVDEKAELDALVLPIDSARGRQRTIALWLGLRRKKVEVEHLRELAQGFEAYNVANFAQNMKKDGIYFEEQSAPDGGRLGWRLTPEGKREAKALVKTALATV